MRGCMSCRAVVVAMVLAAAWLSGCAATAPHLVAPLAGKSTRSLPPGGVWLLYVRDEPVAEVEVAEPSRNNRVDVRVRDEAVKVTLRHGGTARLTPLARQLQGGLPVVFNEVTPVPSAAQGWLRQSMAEGRYAEVREALLSLPRDEWLALAAALWDEKLAELARSAAGLPLLEQLFSAFISGDEAEARQAQRILAAVAQLRPPEEFAKAVLSPKTKRIPYRAFGITVSDTTPLDARWRDDGKIEVQLNSRVFKPPYREEALTLEGLRFLVLDADEVVGVTLYDEGGKEVFAPALILLQLAHADNHRVRLKMLEPALLGAGLGLSSAGLGAGALMEGGVEVSVLARVLAICDVAALGLFVAASILDEHRGWILERFGEDGAAFLRATDRVNSAVALYGMARLVMAAPKLVGALRGSYQNYLARAKAMEGLTPAEAQRLKDLRGPMDGFFRKVDEIQARRAGGGGTAALDGAPPPAGGAKVIPLDRARTRGGKPPESTVQQPPPMEEEALAATGTGGKLVPIRRHAPSREGITVASRERKQGAGVTPGGSAPPTSQPGRAPGANGRSQAEQGTKKSSSRLKPIEGGVDMAEMSAEEYAARKFAELEWSEPERLAGTRAELERLRPQLAHRPPGVPPDEQFWPDYVRYFDGRLGKVAEHENGQLATRPKNPVGWERYRGFREITLRGIKHENKIADVLAHDLALPPAQRVFTRGMEQPRIDRRVGIRKEGDENVLYVDFLVIDMATVGPGKTARAVSISTKSRDIRAMTEDDALAVARGDLNELQTKYGGVLEVRRPGHPAFRQKVEVTQQHLIYDENVAEGSTNVEAILNELNGMEIEVHFR